MKRNHPAVNVLENGKPISFLHVQGKFLPGEKAEQWRGEGTCKPIGLPEVLDLIPHFTITSMVRFTSPLLDATMINFRNNYDRKSHSNFSCFRFGKGRVEKSSRGT